MGFNVYRNGIKQNSALLTATNYTDTLPMSDAITYGVTAVDASAQEGLQRIVTVNPVAFGFLANAAGTGTNNPLLTGYFDQFQAGITNLSGSASLTLAGLVWNRTLPGADPLTVAQNLRRYRQSRRQCSAKRYRRGSPGGGHPDHNA